MSTPYSSYRGQSVGRVIHAFWLYNDGYNSLHPDEIQVGNGKVIYHGVTIAQYSWKEPDIPVFVFSADVDWRRLGMAQFIMQPFIDDPVMLSNATHAVQEVRRVIALDEAMYLMWIRDTHNGNWDVAPVPNSLHARIQNKLVKCYWGREDPMKHWKHFAMCAIYGLRQD